MRRLIDKDTQEQLTLAGPVLPDGRVLIQWAATGCIEVMYADRLALAEAEGSE